MLSKFLELNTYIKKEEKLQFNNLCSYYKKAQKKAKLRQRQQMKENNNKNRINQLKTKDTIQNNQ